MFTQSKIMKGFMFCTFPKKDRAGEVTTINWHEPTNGYALHWESYDGLHDTDDHGLLVLTPIENQRETGGPSEVFLHRQALRIVCSRQRALTLKNFDEAFALFHNLLN